MSSYRYPHLTAQVHMAMVNAGDTVLSTAQVAAWIGLPPNGMVGQYVWYELDRLARRGLVVRIRHPHSRFCFWQRTTPAVA